MAGLRVRCICGTVFDPTAMSACPACGTPYEAKSAPTAPDPLPLPPTPSPIPGREDGRRGDPGAGSSGGASLIEQNRTAVTIGLGVIGLLLLALVVRGMFGGSDKPRASKDTTERVALKDDAAAEDRGAGDGDTHHESTRNESSRDSDHDENGSDERRDDGDDDGGARHSRDVVPSTTNDDLAPRRRERSDDSPVRPAPPSDVRLFAGKWKLLTSRMQPEPVIPGMPATSSTIAQVVTAAFGGPASTATLIIDANGGYVLDVDVKGEGQYTANLAESPNLLSVASQGVITLLPKGGAAPDRARAQLKPVRMDLPQMHAKADDTQLALISSGESGGSPSNWFRSSSEGEPHTSVLGVWAYEPVYVDSYMPYRATLKLKENGDYEIRFTRREEGILKAAGGEYEFARSVRMGQPLTGEYEFDGPDRFTLTESRGTATWVRDAADAATKKRGVRR